MQQYGNFMNGLWQALHERRGRMGRIERDLQFLTLEIVGFTHIGGIDGYILEFGIMDSNRKLTVVMRGGDEEEARREAFAHIYTIWNRYVRQHPFPQPVW